MWSGEQEMSEKGVAVLLLEPNAKKPNKITDTCTSDACSSFIGGVPIFFNGESKSVEKQHPICEICEHEMYLILQMYAPLDGLDRTMMVFGCNNASCIQSAMNASTDNSGAFRFCPGGKGVIRCIRSQRTQETHILSTGKPTSKEEKVSVSNWDDGMGWEEDDDAADGWNDKNDDDGGWGAANDDGDNNSTTSMDDLEAMLAAMESNESSKKSDNKDIVVKGTKTKHENKKWKGDDAANVKSFPKFDLDVYDEPSLSLPKRFGQDDDSDDDDDDAVASNDLKIQKLLTKYLKEEDDNEILSAINDGPGNSGGSGSGGGSGEKYEKAPPEERAFLAFTNRVRRAPKQSVRYAYGGCPLWSIPTPLTQKGKNGRQTRDTSFPVIPPCPCGARREFEFQVMPSILHVLGVDKFIDENEKESKHAKELDHILSKNSGGMNWGTIAVYSCVLSCELSDEEYVVVQESADGDPQKRELKIAEEPELDNSIDAP